MPHSSTNMEMYKLTRLKQGTLLTNVWWTALDIEVMVQWETVSCQSSSDRIGWQLKTRCSVKIDGSPLVFPSSPLQQQQILYYKSNKFLNTSKDFKNFDCTTILVKTWCMGFGGKHLSPLILPLFLNCCILKGYLLFTKEQSTKKFLFTVYPNFPVLQQSLQVHKLHIKEAGKI